MIKQRKMSEKENGASMIQNTFHSVSSLCRPVLIYLFVLYVCKHYITRCNEASEIEAPFDYDAFGCCQ